MDYVIIGVIFLLAALYIFRHVRSMLRQKEGASTCGGCCGACGSGESECNERPLAVTEGGKKLNNR